MTFGQIFKPMSAEQREAGRKADEELAEKQNEALVDQLHAEGRLTAADLVRDLIDNLKIARSRIESLEATPTKKKRTVKTSGGKERASAAGTSNAGGKAVHGAGSGKQGHQHKHEYGTDGKCIKVSLGVPCPAVRQRQRKAKQLPLGTDGGKTTGTSEAGS